MPLSSGADAAFVTARTNVDLVTDVEHYPEFVHYAVAKGAWRFRRGRR